MDVEKIYISQLEQDFKELFRKTRHYQINHIFSNSEERLDEIESKFDLQMKRLKGTLEGISPDDKYEWMDLKRLSGLNKMKKYDTFGALQEYFIAISQLKFNKEENDLGLKLINNLGQTAVQLKQIEIGFKCFGIVISLDKNDYKAHFRLAKLYLDSQELKNAAYVQILLILVRDLCDQGEKIAKKQGISVEEFTQLKTQIKQAQAKMRSLMV